MKFFNKDMYIGFAILIVVMWILLMLTSCHHKKLCYHHPHYVDVYVVYDWQHDPTANPEKMQVIFFPQDEYGVYSPFELKGKNGGKVSLPFGDYMALSYNGDAEDVLFRNAKSFTDIEVYSKDATVLEGIRQMAQSLPKSKGAEDERMVTPAVKMWADQANAGLHLTREDCELQNTHEVCIPPYPLYCEYSVEIRHVKNLSGMGTLLGASLSGMASGVFLKDRTQNEDVVTIPFDMKFSKTTKASSEDKGDKISESMTLAGDFLTFGYNAKLNPQHNLVVYAVLTDGSKWYSVFDVSEQVRQAPDPRHVHIVIDGLTFPTPTPGSSSGGISVKDWTSISTDVTL